VGYSIGGRATGGEFCLLPHVVEFNLTHKTAFSDEEYEARMGEAWPYRFFVLAGGARANLSLLGDMGGSWYQVLRKGQTVTGSDDPTTLNTWAENQWRRMMGLELLSMPEDQSQLADTLMGAPPATLMG
jgi:hypothetical protein